MKQRRACLFRCSLFDGVFERASLMSSPSLHIISLCGSNQQPLISVFITRLIPRSLIVIQGEFSICAGAKYSH